MKKLLILISTLIVVILGAFILNTRRNESYSYLTTSYSTEKTVMVSYTGEINQTEIDTFTVKCVEKIYDLEIGRLLADKYGNKALLLTEGEPSSQNIEFEYFNICDVVEYDNYIYVLFSPSLNTAKIVKYDVNFNPIDESKELQGDPRNIVIYDDTIYLLANDYSDNSRKSIISSISIEEMGQTNSVTIDSLVFVFHLVFHDGDLIAYGNTEEDNFSFGLSVFNTNLEEIDTRRYNYPALWVRKSITYSDYWFVLNDVSIIKLDQAYETIDIYQKADYIMVDAMVVEDTLYALIRNVEKNETVIELIDPESFETKDRISITEGLEEDYMVPTLLLKTN